MNRERIEDVVSSPRQITPACAAVERDPGPTRIPLDASGPPLLPDWIRTRFNLLINSTVRRRLVDGLGRLPRIITSRFGIVHFEAAVMNGNLVVTGQNAKGQSEVFVVSTAGASMRYKIPAAISNAFGTYLGPADGSLWFAYETSGAIKIGQITACGVATSENLSKFVRSRFPLNSVALGQDGNLYVLDNGNTSATVHRLSPSDLSAVRGVGRPQSRG